MLPLRRIHAKHLSSGFGDNLVSAHFSSSTRMLFAFMKSGYPQWKAFTRNTFTLMCIINGFQLCFLGFKRVDIFSMGFPEVMKTLGRYLDPSIRFLSSTALITFFIISSILCIIPILLMFALCLTSTAQKRMNQFLRNTASFLLLLTSRVLRIPNIIFLLSPLMCFINSSIADSSSISISIKSNLSFCEGGSGLDLGITGAVFVFVLNAFWVLVFYFHFQPTLSEKSDFTLRRTGLLAFVESAISAVVMAATLLQVLSPVFTSLGIGLAFLLLALLVALNQPFFSIRPNTIYCAMLSAASGAGWASFAIGFIQNLLVQLGAVSLPETKAPEIVRKEQLKYEPSSVKSNFHFPSTYSDASVTFSSSSSSFSLSSNPSSSSSSSVYYSLSALSWIICAILPVLFAFLGAFLSKANSHRKWLLKPVYEQTKGKTTKKDKEEKQKTIENENKDSFSKMTNSTSTSFLLSASSSSSSSPSPSSSSSSSSSSTSSPSSILYSNTQPPNPQTTSQEPPHPSQPTPHSLLQQRFYQQRQRLHSLFHPTSHRSSRIIGFTLVVDGVKSEFRLDRFHPDVLRTHTALKANEGKTGGKAKRHKNGASRGAEVVKINTLLPNQNLFGTLPSTPPQTHSSPFASTSPPSSSSSSSANLLQRSVSPSFQSVSSPTATPKHHHSRPHVPPLQISPSSSNSSSSSSASSQLPVQHLSLVDQEKLVKRLVKNWESPDDIEPSLRFLQFSEFGEDPDVLGLVLALLEEALKKPVAVDSADARVTFALFMQHLLGVTKKHKKLSTAKKAVVASAIMNSKGKNVPSLASNQKGLMASASSLLLSSQITQTATDKEKPSEKMAGKIPVVPNYTQTTLHNSKEQSASFTSSPAHTSLSSLATLHSGSSFASSSFTSDGIIPHSAIYPNSYFDTVLSSASVTTRLHLLLQEGVQLYPSLLNKWIMAMLEFHLDESGALKEHRKRKIKGEREKNSGGKGSDGGDNQQVYEGLVYTAAHAAERSYGVMQVVEEAQREYLSAVLHLRGMWEELCRRTINCSRVMHSCEAALEAAKRSEKLYLEAMERAPLSVNVIGGYGRLLMDVCNDEEFGAELLHLGEIVVEEEKFEQLRIAEEERMAEDQLRQRLTEIAKERFDSFASVEREAEEDEERGREEEKEEHGREEEDEEGEDDILDEMNDASLFSTKQTFDSGKSDGEQQKENDMKQKSIGMQNIRKEKTSNDKPSSKLPFSPSSSKNAEKTEHPISPSPKEDIKNASHLFPSAHADTHSLSPFPPPPHPPSSSSPSPSPSPLMKTDTFSTYSSSSQQDSHQSHLSKQPSTFKLVSSRYSTSEAAVEGMTHDVAEILKKYPSSLSSSFQSSKEKSKTDSSSAHKEKSKNNSQFGYLVPSLLLVGIVAGLILVTSFILNEVLMNGVKTFLKDIKFSIAISESASQMVRFVQDTSLELKVLEAILNHTTTATTKNRERKEEDLHTEWKEHYNKGSEHSTFSSPSTVSFKFERDEKSICETLDKHSSQTSSQTFDAQHLGRYSFQSDKNKLQRISSTPQIQSISSRLTTDNSFRNNLITTLHSHTPLQSYLPFSEITQPLQNNSHIYEEVQYPHANSTHSPSNSLHSISLLTDSQSLITHTLSILNKIIQLHTKAFMTNFSMLYDSSPYLSFWHSNYFAPTLLLPVPSDLSQLSSYVALKTDSLNALSWVADCIAEFGSLAEEFEKLLLDQVDEPGGGNSFGFKMNKFDPSSFSESHYPSSLSSSQYSDDPITLLYFLHDTYMTSIMNVPISIAESLKQLSVLCVSSSIVQADQALIASSVCCTIGVVVTLAFMIGPVLKARSDVIKHRKCSLTTLCVLDEDSIERKIERLDPTFVTKAKRNQMLLEKEREREELRKKQLEEEKQRRLRLKEEKAKVREAKPIHHTVTQYTTSSGSVYSTASSLSTPTQSAPALASYPFIATPTSSLPQSQIMMCPMVSPSISPSASLAYPINTYQLQPYRSTIADYPKDSKQQQLAQDGKVEMTQNPTSPHYQYVPFASLQNYSPQVPEGLFDKGFSERTDKKVFTNASVFDTQTSIDSSKFVLKNQSSFDPQPTVFVASELPKERKNAAEEKTHKYDSTKSSLNRKEITGNNNKRKEDASSIEGDEGDESSTITSIKNDSSKSASQRHSSRHHHHARRKVIDKQSEEELEMLTELAKANEEDAQKRKEQRSTDVEEQLRHLTHIVPASYLSRMIWGMCLMLSVIAVFFALVIVESVLISDEMGKLAMEGQRSVLTSQIAGFAAMLVSNSTVGEEHAAVFEYERSNGKEWQERLKEMSKHSSKHHSTSSSLEEATQASLQITSPVLFNTSFLLSQQKVASVLKGLNSLLISLNSILLVGSDSAPPSGDDAIDSMTASRSQGVNHDVETLLNSKVKCLMLNEALCKEGRIAGMTDEFYGLNALLLLFIDNVQTLTNAKDEELVPTNPSFQFITTASKFDLGDGIKMAELLREKYIKGVVNVIPSLVIVLFIIFLIVMLMVFALCFSPLPRILRGVQSKTMYIEHLATSAEEEQIVWSEELVTQVGRMDEAHHVLVDTLAAIVALVAQHAPLAEVAQAGDKLLAVAMIHFADEEQMMEATHYPAQVQSRHCQAHVELLGSALAFVAGIEAGEAPLSDVVAFCSMWIMSHIRTADQQLAIYLLRTFDAKRLAQPVPFDRLVLPPSWKAHMRSGALSQKDREQLRCTVKRIKEKEERGESIC